MDSELADEIEIEDEKVLWLLKIDVVNLCKKNIDAHVVKHSIRLIDEDGFEFEPYHNLELHLHGKSGLHRFSDAPLSPKIRATGAIAFLLPDEETKYYIAIKEEPFGGIGQIYTLYESQHVELMRESAERIKEYLASKLPSSILGDLLSNDDARRYAYITKSILAHAYLLSMDWESAYKMSLKENELGWSDSDNPQGLVVICFLGIASGRIPSDFPPNLALLWNESLKNSIDFGEEGTILPRLKEAYEEMLPKATLYDEAETLLRWCLNTSRKRATSIVQNQHRKSYWKAASLITACAEVLKFRGDEQKAQSLISEIRSQFSRHRSFQSELRKAIVRR